ncbi:hypothetical protein Tco_0837521, partial [Tanacetum coccineum]
RRRRNNEGAVYQRRRLKNEVRVLIQMEEGHILRWDTGCVSQPDWPAVIVINHYQAPQITADQSGCDTQHDVPTLTCDMGTC